MLPSLLDVSEIQRRLLDIFPEGAPQRGYCTREMAARTVFVMLCDRAIEGSGVWMSANMFTGWETPNATTSIVKHTLMRSRNRGSSRPPTAGSTTIRESLFAMKHYGTVS